MPRRKIVVSAIVPADASDDEIVQFVADALSTWGGQFHPADPLFHSLAVQTVTIRGKLYDIDHTEQK